MVVANSVSNHIAIFLGNSNGTFSDPVTYPTGPYSTPYVVAVGDLNNDSRLDIAVANFGTKCFFVYYVIKDSTQHTSHNRRSDVVSWLLI